MVPWVPINTILYTKPIISNGQVKYLKINKNTKGDNRANEVQESRDSQFFLVLNILIREKNSEKICPTEGFIKLP